MKRFIAIALLFGTLIVNAQETTFKKFYKNHKEEATFSLNLPTFLVNGFIDNDDIDKEILNKAVNFKMLVCENKTQNISKDFKKFSKRNNLKTLIRAKDGKDKMNLYFLEEGDFINEIIMVVEGDGDESVFMGLKTKKLTKDELVAFIAEK